MGLIKSRVFWRLGGGGFFREGNVLEKGGSFKFFERQKQNYTMAMKFKMLKLPKDTSKAFFHAEIADGGLEIPLLG